MSDNRLSRTEEKLIKRYYLWPSLALPAFIAAIAVVVETFIFFIVYDAFLLGYMDEKYIGLMLLGFVFFMVVFVITALVPRIGTTRQRWESIVKKANEDKDLEHVEISSLDELDDINTNPIGVIEPVTGKGSINLIRNTAKSLRQATKEIADYYHIKLPNYRLWQKLVVLVPTVGLLCIFVPECLSLKFNVDYNKDAIRTNGEILASYLDDIGLDTYGPDVDGSITDYNFVSGYYLDYANNVDISMDFSLDRDGNVNGINVREDVRYDDPQENIDEINRIAEELYKIIEDSGVPVANEDMFKYRQIPSEFASAYLSQQENNIQLYQDVDGDNNDTLSVSFSYEPYNTKYDLSPRLRYSVRYYIYRD